MWVEQKKRNWKRKVITLHEDGEHFVKNNFVKRP